MCCKLDFDEDAYMMAKEHRSKVSVVCPVFMDGIKFLYLLQLRRLMQCDGVMGWCDGMVHLEDNSTMNRNT